MERLMIIFLFILCISGMGMFFEYRKQQLKMMAKMNAMDEGKLQRDLAAIKQRLAVLEKIITDKRYDLDEEFKSLGNKN
jgi:Tfp pilus assembly protein PilO